MTLQKVSLADKFDLTKSQILLNGTQALVRLMLSQKARDTAAGLNTAGYVTGYRGSPLGAVDHVMNTAAKQLHDAEVVFQPGLNEDLAATALWGAQQAGLRQDGTHDGVFGLWYGKGPGVDRSGDAMRHANMAGTAKHGGVLMALGDDPTGESSTVLHQSEWALVDAYMPIVSPAGVQEIIDYGLYGIALSRFSGLWVGLKVLKDTIEVTSVVDGDPHRLSFVTPEFEQPEGGMNIRLVDDRIDQETRLINYKRKAAEAFARANRIDKRVWGKPGAKIGLVSAGKNWLDLQHALSLLNIDQAEAERLGITTYKIGQVWPLDTQSFEQWAEGLDLIIVVEEKRKLIEVQVKEAIFDNRQGRRVYGWHKGASNEELFPTRWALDPVMIAEKLGDILVEEERGSEAVKTGLAALIEAKRADNAESIATRLAYFCAGCPHNTGTKVPEGSRAYAGIGCHFMVQWMDRNTIGNTHMGAEGANWIGEAPFSKTEHVFQNLGDGTYNHSGILAIRAALVADTNITYKILYNDAVAMTGGQSHEDDLKPDRIVRELLAMGVKNVALVYDEKEDISGFSFPSEAPVLPRDELMQTQQDMRKIKGVTAIVYVQTCAAEKRRRRKRGTFPDIDKRVFINTDICEGCGDCGLQSNCVAIEPVETELGRKRKINQSSCNKDFSCLQGFCPSLMTVEGATLRKAETAALDLPEMPMPAQVQIDGTFNVVITGVGGTGVVTIGAVLAQAAQIDGKAAGMMEMAGLAQKGGAVLIHCRLAEKPEDISAIRVATGECDALIGGDLVVSAESKTLGLTRLAKTGAVVNSHEIITGDFTRDTEFTIPVDRLELALQARLKDRVALFDASELARRTLGDSIFSNMMVFGGAFQQALVPLSHAAIVQAIKLNGAAVERNLRAFEIGRWAVLYPEQAAEMIKPSVVALPKTTDEQIAFRADHLVQYQDAKLAVRYRFLVDGITDETLRLAVAKGYHKLLSYKDEYEVARLHLNSVDKARATFDGDFKMSFHLAPPLISGKEVNGRPKKREFGPGMLKWFRLLARMKALRGTRLDVFGRTDERRMERALIDQYESDMARVLSQVTENTREVAVALAELPLQIKGFGLVKLASEAKASKRREELLASFESGGALVTAAAE